MMVWWNLALCAGFDVVCGLMFLIYLFKIQTKSLLVCIMRVFQIKFEMFETEHTIRAVHKKNKQQ